MVVLGKSGCIRAKVVVFGQKRYSGKVVVFALGGCIRIKWLYSGKNGSIPAKLVVFGENGCIQAKVVLFGKGCCIRAKWLYSGK